MSKKEMSKGIFIEYFLCTRKNNPEEFNKICDANEIFGINRTSFETMLDDLEK